MDDNVVFQKQKVVCKEIAHWNSKLYMLGFWKFFNIIAERIALLCLVLSSSVDL